MRTTMFSMALLGIAAAAPALAQNTPAAPGRDRPAATMQDRAAPAADAQAPATAPADRSGTTSVGPSTEGGQRAVTIDDGTRTASTPQAGANSFTEGQAKSRIEAAGFSDVSELQKDDQGIWRGRGMRNGQQTSVALDYQGNVVGR